MCCVYIDEKVGVLLVNLPRREDKSTLARIMWRLLFGIGPRMRNDEDQ